MNKSNFLIARAKEVVGSGAHVGTYRFGSWDSDFPNEIVYYSATRSIIPLTVCDRVPFDLEGPLRGKSIAPSVMCWRTCANDRNRKINPRRELIIPNKFRRIHFISNLFIYWTNKYSTLFYKSCRCNHVFKNKLRLM